MLYIKIQIQTNRNCRASSPGCFSVLDQKRHDRSSSPCQPDLTFYSRCCTNTFGRFHIKLFIHKNIFCYPKTTSASSSFSPNREQYTKYCTLLTVSLHRIMDSFDSGDLLHTFCRVVTAVIVVRGSSTLLTMAQFSTLSLVYMNSSLNPALYCWRIKEVRQAVKQTIRQLPHCISF